jgi:hypothetical protein
MLSLGKKNAMHDEHTVYIQCTDCLICGCSHLLTRQRFSKEHLGSFIAGTEDFKERKMFLVQTLKM